MALADIAVGIPALPYVLMLPYKALALSCFHRLTRCVSPQSKRNTMTSRAGALVPDLQRCIDSNRDLAERLYVLVQIDAEHKSLQDHRQILKHCRGILDYLFLVISSAGQTLPQTDIEQFSQMLGNCKTDQDLMSERLLQIEKLPAFATILSAVPRDRRTWVSIDQQKSYFLNHWLKETPVVLSSRDEAGTRKATEQQQPIQLVAERQYSPPDAPKGTKNMDLTGRTSASGICIPPSSTSQSTNSAQFAVPHRASPFQATVLPKTPAGLSPLGNEIQQANEASCMGPQVDSNNSTRSSPITGKSAPHGELPQPAALVSPDMERKRRRRRRGNSSSTGESVSRGETPKSVLIALPDTTQSTAPQKKKRKRPNQKDARLSRELDAMKSIPSVVNQEIPTNVNKRPVSEQADDSSFSRPVKRMQMDDLVESKDGQGQNQESTSQNPVLSSPLSRYQGKKHLTQEELASLKAYTLDLLRDLQAEAGDRGASVNLSGPEPKPTSRRSKAMDFF